MRAVLAAAFALAIPAQPCFAQGLDWGDDVEVLGEAEMSELRGGIRLTPALEVNFGALVTTHVNGAPAFATQITWTQAGALVERSMGELGIRLGALTPAERGALGLEGLDGADGVVIADASGATALIHNVADGTLQNIIINDASGRDLRQDIAVTLALPGFEAVQKTLELERMGLRLDAEMRNALSGN